MSQRTQKPARPVTAALDRLEQLYEQASAGLVAALGRYLEAGERPGKEALAGLTYPLLRVVYHDTTRPLPTHRRAFGRLQRIGAYETTVTHPREFRSYLVEQLQPLASEYGARIEVESSRQRIPYPYVLDRTDELAGAVVNVADLARYFPTPQLSGVGDETADGEFDFGARAAARPVRCAARRLLAPPPCALYRLRLAGDAALGAAHQLSPLCRPVRALGR